ncbi:MAG: glycosyltransferase family 2 protein [Ignavibacteriae bacterium]|nr:glycosyltransferase family 2 protein [Ignavibacteriota bacterium]
MNYNGLDFLENCLKSVLAQTFSDFEIIFVDNGSIDGSIDYVKREFNDERLKCFSAVENLGFAGGNNFGLKYSCGEYIVLLNNDTVVDENWLKYLYETITSGENIGAVQSLVLTEGIPERYYKKNGTLNLLGHNIMEVFSINENGTGEIFQLNGCSFIIRKSTLDELGGLFPDEYFAYAEDSYLSFKLKFAGYKILHTSKSVVKHLGSATTKDYRSSFRTFLQERNRLMNFLIFFSAGFRRKYYPFLIKNLFLKIMLSLLPGKYSLKGILKAYLDLFRKRHWIKSEREKIDRIKKVNENEVLNFLSGKIFNGNNFAEKYFNFFSLLYCRIARIKVMELK